MVCWLQMELLLSPWDCLPWGLALEMRFWFRISHSWDLLLPLFCAGQLLYVWMLTLITFFLTFLMPKKNLVGDQKL